MPTFDYISRDSRGTLIRGRVEAEDDKSARARVRQQGLFVTALRLAPSAYGRTPVGRSRSEVATFTNNLAMLVGAGLPLFQALEAVVEQTEEKGMRDTVRQLARSIQEGKSLSAALSNYPEFFSPLYIGIVHSGESTGRLDQALNRLATFLERDLELRRKVRDTLIYPGVVFTLALVVLTVFLVYIIPVFDRVYRSHGVVLPLLTRILMAWSVLFRANLPLLALVVILFIVRPTRRMIWPRLVGPLQTLVLRVPHARALIRTLIASRFTQAMGSMLQSGMSVVPALEVAGTAVSAPGFDQVVTVLAADLSRGRRLSDAMLQTRQFPPMIIRMVALGEESGQLDTMLERAGTILDREFDLRMRRLLTYLEPVLTLLVGGLVGVILLALYLPIFGLSRAIVR